MPGAVVSFFFPPLGLIFLGPQQKSSAIKLFVVYLVASIVLSVLVSITYSISYSLGGLMSGLYSLIQLALHVGGMIHTHDETVRAFPQLGQPIYFKQPLQLPAQLK